VGVGLCPELDGALQPPHRPLIGVALPPLHGRAEQVVPAAAAAGPGRRRRSPAGQRERAEVLLPLERLAHER